MLVGCCQWVGSAGARSYELQQFALLKSPDENDEPCVRCSDKTTNLRKRLDTLSRVFYYFCNQSPVPPTHHPLE